MSMSYPNAARKMSSLRGVVASLFFSAVLVLVLCLTATIATAAAPPQAPFPPQAPSLDERVTKLEQQVADLQACKCNQSRPVAAAASAAPTQYRQVCGPDGCKWVKTASATNYASRPPVGDFIYDPADSPPQPSDQSQAQTYGATGFTRQPFRPIRNLIGRFRNRGGSTAGGGCSSCGN